LRRALLRLLAVALTGRARADDVAGQASVVDGDTLEIHGMTLIGAQDGYPKTQIVMDNGAVICVFDTPDDIAEWTKTANPPSATTDLITPRIEPRRLSRPALMPCSVDLDAFLSVNS
jgi:hypothetical protein